MFTHPQLQRARVHAERSVLETREHREPGYALVVMMGFYHGLLGKTVLGNMIFAMAILKVASTLNEADGRAQRLLYVFAAGVFLGDIFKSYFPQSNSGVQLSNNQPASAYQRIVLVKR